MADLGLNIAERLGFGLATVMARRDTPATAIGSALNTNAPDGPRKTTNGDLTLLGVGPGAWLALNEQAPPDAAERLRAALDGLASVSDQSSGYIIYRLSGPGARTVLQRGVAIDLHPDAFGPDDVAVTMIAHIGVIVWQVDQRPTFDVAIFRSLAASFRRWLDETSATL